MKRLLLLIVICSIWQINSVAQISYGGTPPSFEYENNLRSSLQPLLVSTSGTDFKEMLRQDKIAEENGSPMRVAINFPVDVDIQKTGEWVTLPNTQKIWRQTIWAKGAKGLILSYQEFYIPEGGQLFLYNKDKSQILGAYNHTTNKKGGSFSTQFTLGDEVTLEYVASDISSEEPRIIVEDIGYMYRNSSNDDEIEDEENPEEYELPEKNPHPDDYIVTETICMVNINCEEGDNWQDQKRGVVQIYGYHKTRGWYNCTGSLINNTKNDATPYVLSAAHCFFEADGSEKGVFEKTQFYFNYEWPDCENGDQNEMPSTTRCLIGGENLVAGPMGHYYSDGQLLLLNEEVPLEWNPYFNGWDRTSDTPESGVIIHHPKGTVKKISTYIDSPTPTYYNNYYRDYWWEVYYTQTENGFGVSAGGSSGSPMFNQNKLIVGTLTGGYTYCTRTYSNDQYGMFSKHWNYSITKAKFEDFLDPDGTGVEVLEGYDPNVVGIKDNNTKKERTQLVIFPNPTSDEMHINTRSMMEEITVADMNGRIIYKQDNHKSSTITIPVSAWQKGIYNVLIKTVDGNLSEKLIKD